MKIQLSEHPPSVNALFFNRGPHHHGKKGRGKTPEYRQWIEVSGYEILVSRAKPVEGPVRICLKYEDRGKADLDNLIKPVIDLLVTQQIIPDDTRKTVRKVIAEWDGEIKGVLIEVVKA